MAIGGIMIRTIIGSILVIGFAHAPSASPPPTWQEYMLVALLGMVTGIIVYAIKRLN